VFQFGSNDCIKNFKSKSRFFNKSNRFFIINQTKELKQSVKIIYSAQTNEELQNQINNRWRYITSTDRMLSEKEIKQIEDVCGSMFQSFGYKKLEYDKLS
jgi:hypothetical protein